MLASLREEDLKMANEAYWGEERNHQYKKKSLPSLNAFRKNIRKS